MDGGFHLPLCLWPTASGLLVIGAPQFRHFPRDRVFHQADTFNDVRVTQPHLTTQGQAKKLFRRILFEIILVNVEVREKGT